MPSISVVIPCFNAGTWLPDALACLDKQRVEGLEVIVVDDGSTDEPTQLVLQTASKSGCVVLRHERNRGLAAARNTGIRSAHGEVIVPLDADDLLPDGTLATLRAAFALHPGADFVFGHCLEMNETGGVTHTRCSKPDADIRFSPGMPWVGCSPFRKRLWERVGGYDESELMRSAPEDWDYWVRCVAAGASGVHLDQVLYIYRIRQGSLYTGGMVNEFAGKLRTMQKLPDGFFPGAERRRVLLAAAMLNATTWRRRGKPWLALAVLMRAVWRYPLTSGGWRAAAGCVAETLIPRLRRRYA